MRFGFMGSVQFAKLCGLVLWGLCSLENYAVWFYGVRAVWKIMRFSFMGSMQFGKLCSLVLWDPCSLQNYEVRFLWGPYSLENYVVWFYGVPAVCKILRFSLMGSVQFTKLCGSVLCSPCSFENYAVRFYAVHAPLKNLWCSFECMQLIRSMQLCS